MLWTGLYYYMASPLASHSFTFKILFSIRKNPPPKQKQTKAAEEKKNKKIYNKEVHKIADG